MRDKVFNVLFLCTCNTTRSLLAEAQLIGLGKGRFRAFSAGSFPTGTANTNAINFLQQIGLPTENLRSKSWNEFSANDAPVMDFILTICDDAAQQQSPIWPGQPIAAHWGLADPGKVFGSAYEKNRAFVNTCSNLRQRIELFISLLSTELDRKSIKHRLDEIGKFVCVR